MTRLSEESISFTRSQAGRKRLRAKKRGGGESKKSLAALLPLKQRLARTDRLIDLVVYGLYGLTEEEIRVVEGQSRPAGSLQLSTPASVSRKTRQVWECGDVAGGDRPAMPPSRKVAKKKESWRLRFARPQ